MKIIKIGDWEDSEKELYGGECGLIIRCNTREELISLLTPEVKEKLFDECTLELKVVEAGK